MRLNTEFRDFELLGSEIKNPFGRQQWSIRLWNERNNRVRHYLMADRECCWSDAQEWERPEDLEAVYAAMSSWESSPACLLSANLP
jgi:hypothetical protein